MKLENGNRNTFKRKKVHSEDGFLLIESLVSLSVLSIVLISLLPFMVDLLTFRQNEKQHVEMNRMLFDSSRSWDGSFEVKADKSGDWHYTIQLEDKGIHVVEELGSEKKVEIQFIEFQP